MTQKIEKEIRQGDKDYILVVPSVKQSNDADIVYSRAYVEAIRGGLKPKSLLEKEYREAEVITEEMDREFDELSKKLHEIIIRMRSVKTEEDKNALYAEYIGLKSEYEVSIIQRNFLFQHSAEAKAETAKITNLAWQCILNSDRTNVWKNEAEFNNSKNSVLIDNLLREFVLFISGLDEAESKLEDIINKFMNSDQETPSTETGVVV